ncbi:MAG: caspase family protein, partial [Betaproteobacteria bacterium]
LVPIGAQMDREDEVPYQAVEAGLVLDKMETAKNALNILILDACRNNPFARSWRSSGDKGLAQVKAPTGTLISYATAPGSAAADGTGEHGLYTSALLQQLNEPGMEMEKVFKRVREKVLATSQGAQTPWESNSTVGDFYFRPQRTAEDIAREQAVLAEETR